MAEPTSHIVIIFIVVAQLVLFSIIIRPMFCTWIRIIWCVCVYICILEQLERKSGWKSTTHRTEENKKKWWARRHTHKIGTRHIFVEHEKRGQLSQTKARSKKCQYAYWYEARGKMRMKNTNRMGKKHVWIYIRVVYFPCGSLWKGWWLAPSLQFFFHSLSRSPFSRTFVCKMSDLLKLDPCAFSALSTSMLNHIYSYCQANCDGHVVEYPIWCIYLCLLQ